MNLLVTAVIAAWSTIGPGLSTSLDPNEDITGDGKLETVRVVNVTGQDARWEVIDLESGAVIATADMGPYRPGGTIRVHHRNYDTNHDGAKDAILAWITQPSSGRRMVAMAYFRSVE